MIQYLCMGGAGEGSCAQRGVGISCNSAGMRAGKGVTNRHCTRPSQQQRQRLTCGRCPPRPSPPPPHRGPRLQSRKLCLLLSLFEGNIGQCPPPPQCGPRLRLFAQQEPHEHAVCCAYATLHGCKGILLLAQPTRSHAEQPAQQLHCMAATHDQQRSGTPVALVLSM